MPIPAGTHLGPYEIVSAIGAGGMGEVYKARDTRLERLVAIKVLPADKLADAERKRRFINEAKAASALNHPSIVTVYDIGCENGVDFIAMEFVQGRTLEELTPRDGLRLPELLRYAVQAADAVAKAHTAGIVHRDLKPGNIMVTGDGLVKVLDFGLAKLVQPEAQPSVETTRTVSPATEGGLIVGTASFMSPEQAEGRPVDARSDIFAFGAVLYEMATGRRAFRGDTTVSTMSAILRDEPKPVSTLRRELPAELERLIKRCLRKDPGRRFQTMADLKVALEELKEESDSGTLVGSAPAAASGPRRASSRLPLLAVASVAALAVGIAGTWFISRKPAATVAPQRPSPLTAYQGDELQPSFSPDGSQVAFTWNGEKQDNFDLYVKVVGPGAPLRLTSDPAQDYSPRWSPDGRTIAFVRGTGQGQLAVMLIPALGGPERTLARFDRRTNVSIPLLDWSPDGKWLVAAGGAGDDFRLQAISVESGEMHPLTRPAASVRDVEPAVSPDGRSVAYARVTGMQVSEIWVLKLSDAMAPLGEPRKLAVEGTFAREPVWTADGRDLLYASGLDLRSNIYRIPADGSGPSRLVESLGDGVGAPSVSAGSHRLAYSRQLRNSNIWRLDLQAPTRPPEPFISSTVREAFPQYSPDGKRVVFYSNRSGDNQIWVCDADGTRVAQLTTMGGTITGTPRWAPDSRQISFDSNAGGNWQIYVMNADGGKPRALTNDALGNAVSSWSRDGRWVYFIHASPEQVWKAPATGGAAVQVTRHGGSAAMESPDGKTLYFTRSLGANRSALWRMPVDGGEETQVGPTVYRYNYAPTANGVYYATPARPDQPSSVEYLDFKTGKVTKLYTLTKPVDLGLAVSPDGRYLLVAQNDFSGSDLMLVENFK